MYVLYIYVCLGHNVATKQYTRTVRIVQIGSSCFITVLAAYKGGRKKGTYKKKKLSGRGGGCALPDSSEPAGGGNESECRVPTTSLWPEADLSVLFWKLTGT